MPLYLSASDAPFDGQWWLADAPNERVGGRLSLDGDVWRLELFGWLGRWDPKRHDTPAPSCLHGYIRNIAVTLTDLVASGWSARGNERPYSQHFALNTVFTGGHLSESVLFQAAYLRVQHLNEWANRPSWEEKSLSTEGDTWRESFTFFQVPNETASVRGALLTLWKDRSQAHTLWSKLTISCDEWVICAFETPQDLAGINHDYVRPLRHLVSLAASADASVLELRLEPVGAAQVAAVSVLSAQPRRAFGPPRTYFDFIFGLSRRPFREVVSRWWDIQAELGVVLDLVAALRLPAPTANLFLNGASAIEGYHRHTSARSMTFAMRAAAVVADAGPFFPPVVGDVNGWLMWVKDGRDGVAHRDPNMVDVDAEWRTTIGVIESMQVLFTLILARRLGVTDAELGNSHRLRLELDATRRNLQAAQPKWFQGGFP